jgi:hypothetical protein
VALKRSERPARGTAPVRPQVSIEALKQSPLYSEELGIDLARGGDPACFAWFLASQLFGGRISQTIAKRTYQSFARHGLLSPQQILEAGWDFLVNPVMREGGYVRYDESKSRRLLHNCRMLLDQGSLTRLHDASADSQDLEERLLAFQGVGPVTVNIFLRELRPHWAKADPQPLPVVQELAGALGLDLSQFDRKSIDFARIEAGLIRRRKHRAGVQEGL